MTAGRPPRVLIDATSVPADRGGVGDTSTACSAPSARSCGSGLDLASWSPAHRPERYARMLPGAEIIAAPAAVAHRPARLAWEQTGLPLLAQQVGAQVLHSPFYTCPLRAGCPVTVTVHDATFFTEPEHYDKSRRTFFRSAIKTSLRRADRVIVPSKATRDELIRLLDADPTRIDVAYHGVDPAAFHAADRGGEGPGTGPAGPGRQQLRRLPRRQGAPQERAEPDPRLGARRWRPRPDPPALVIAGGAGARRRDRPGGGRGPRRTCGCCVPATCATPTCPASSAARWSRPTRRTARGSGCRSWRRWPAPRRC